MTRGIVKNESRLALAFLATALLPLAALSIIAYLTARGSLAEDLLARFDGLAAIQKHRVEALLDRNEERLRHVVGRTTLRTYLEEHERAPTEATQEALTRILGDVARSIPDFEGVSVLTREGVVAASTVPGLAGNPGAWTEAIPEGTGARPIDGFYLDRRGRLMMLLSSPILGPGGPVGRVVIEARAADFLALAEDFAGLGRTGETEVAGRLADGRAVYLMPLRFDPGAALRRVVSPGTAMDVALQGSTLRLDDTVDYRGEPVLAATATIPRMNWGLVVKMDEDEALEPIADLGRMLLALAALTGLVASLLALWISRLLGRAHAARLQSEARLRSLLRTAHDAIVFADREGRITAWNEGATTLFGWTEEEILGEPLTTFMPERFHASHLAAFRKVAAGGVFRLAGRTVELEGRHRDGHEVPIELSLSTWQSGDGPLFCGIIRDTTARREAEQVLREARRAAEEANRAKSEFLANMSHEIRTPMNGIIGMTELLLQTELSPVQRDYLGMVSASADSLLSLLNDILDVSKIEAGRLELESIPFRLREKVGDVLRTFATHAHVKGLELTCRVAPDVPEGLEGDPFRLGQILSNLVGNALKFTSEGEVGVTVRLGEEKDGEALLRFEVRDTGIGIPEAKRDEVFEAFSQADTSTTRQFGGTGLGLAIVSRLAGAMGGTVWLDSREGEGSVFGFSARFAVRADVPAAPAPERRRQLPEGLPVLVVDDNATNRRILVEILTSWRLRPLAVENGPAALEAVRKAGEAGRRFELVVLDHHMPGMDGLAVAERLRADPRLDAGPILLLTSGDTSELSETQRKLGIARRLLKPVKQSELFDAIVPLLSGSSKTVRPEPEAVPEPIPEAPDVRLRILLAEDNPVNQRLVLDVLAARGHEVVVANDGRQAVTLFGEVEPDLVLMDVQMPALDGYEATALLREREEGTGRRVPIVALTAHALKGDREACLEAGMDDYLAKPLKPQALVEMVERRGTPAALDRLQVRTNGGRRRPAGEEEGDGGGDGPFDLSRALQFVSGKLPLLRRMAALLRDDVPPQLRALREALDAGDLDAVGLVAHRIKGSVAYFAAEAAQGAAERVETAAEAGDAEACRAALRDLEAEYRRLEEALATLDEAAA